MNKRFSKKLDYELLFDLYTLEMAHRDYQKFAWRVDDGSIKKTFTREFEALLTEIKERSQESNGQPTDTR